MSKRCALITGITGQDGSYLAEFLLRKGYRVVGATKDPSLASRKLIPSLVDKIELVGWDMFNEHQMATTLSKTRPNEMYNFAAYSSGIGMYDNPIAISEVNGIAVTRMLEAILKVDRNIRFCQASSREVFGEPSESPQNEETKVNPRSPYGAAKLYADTMIKIYRSKFGLFTCSAILYNHESPRRGPEFVTRKISIEAAKIKLGLSKKLVLGNLDSRRDWGFAGDFVQAMWKILQLEIPEDFLIATEQTHTIRDFCDHAFGRLGLQYQDYVVSDSSVYRTSENNVLVGNVSKAKKKLEWIPSMDFFELVAMMVDSDLKALVENTALIKEQGNVKES